MVRGLPVSGHEIEAVYFLGNLPLWPFLKSVADKLALPPALLVSLVPKANLKKHITLSG